MVSELFFYRLVLISLLWLCFILPWVWPSDGDATSPTPSQPPPSLRRRNRQPNPFLASFTSLPVWPVSRRPRPQRP
jgi:hypothetical protein